MIVAKLFISFLKIGAFSFGGGYAMLPLIQEEIIQINGWLHAQEFVDILAIATMTPGPIAINSATFVGYKVAGITGAIAATVAVVLPSFIVMSLIFHFVLKFKNSPFIKWMFSGIRPIVLGLIGAAAVTVGKTAFIDLSGVLIACLVFYLVTFRKTNPIVSLVLAGVLGIIFY